MGIRAIDAKNASMSDGSTAARLRLVRFGLYSNEHSGLCKIWKETVQNWSYEILPLLRDGILRRDDHPCDRAVMNTLNLLAKNDPTSISTSQRSWLRFEHDRSRLILLQVETLTPFSGSFLCFNLSFDDRKIVVWRNEKNVRLRHCHS